MIAHEIPEVIVACANCHTEEPHAGDVAEAQNGYTDRVACQTCHIPELARDPNLLTQMTRNYTAPAYSKAKGLYGPTGGKESKVAPTFLWWDYPRMDTPPWPVGSIDDPGAKITPRKPMEVILPYEAQHQVAPAAESLTVMIVTFLI